MMASQCSTSFEDFLQCSICLERFTQPKALPCQHTFCLSCLKGIVKDAKTLDCPTCRRKHQVPKKGVTAFQDSLMAMNFLSMLGELTECNDCAKKLMISECEHCQQQVCADCRAAHNRLAGEISILIHALELSLVTPDEKIEQAAHASVKHTENAVSLFQAEFDQAIQVLKQRKEEALREVRTVLKIQKCVIQGTTSEAVVGDIRNELYERGSEDSLKRMKKSLIRIEEMVKGERKLGCSYVSEPAAGFGEGKYDEKTVTFETERKSPEGKGIHAARKADSVSAVTVVDSAEELAVGGTSQPNRRLEPYLMAKGNDPVKFPVHIDYEAKKQCWMKIISERPQNDESAYDYFDPAYAAYSPVENVLYCLTSGILLKYDVLTGLGKIISQKFRALDFSITDQGTVMLVNKERVAKIDPGASNEGYDMAPTILNLPSDNAVQICCHRNQFGILDSVNKSIFIFDEQGTILQEIKMNMDVSDGSRMCVDSEGRIYVTGGFRVKGRKDNDDYGDGDDDDDDEAGCNICELSKSVKVNYELVISILAWDGEEIDKMKIEKSRDFKYRFTVRCNEPYRGQFPGSYQKLKFPESCQRDEKRISDQYVLGNGPQVEGICIDGDGYVSVTTHGENQIDVYDPKHKLYCTIGKKEFTYNGPKGLSLMPDGKMVVCKHAKIQIF